MIVNGQLNAGKKTGGNLSTQTESEGTSAEDLQAEIEQAEISHTLFEREFETMRRAVWLKAKGFTQDEKEFLALRAKKAQEARAAQRSSSAALPSANAMPN